MFHTFQSYRIVIALSDVTQLNHWVGLAMRLHQNPVDIHLRGMLALPSDTSLSEGARPAQEMREAMNQLARQYESVFDTTEVLVDYQPMIRILGELSTLETNLLLVQWAGPTSLTGGVDTETILKNTACNVVLLSGSGWEMTAPVLLSLRGGPHLSLGLQVAKALAQTSNITLFHSMGNHHMAHDINVLFRLDKQITRTITASSDVLSSLIEESHGHKAIVMGARLSSNSTQAEIAPLSRRLYEQTQEPVAIVRAKVLVAFNFHLPEAPPPAEDLSTQVDRWFAENTFHSHEFADLNMLLSLKQRQQVKISLALPALNEEATVGTVIKTIKTTLMDEVPLLDEIVLIDSNSTDRTVQIGQSLGIPVYRHAEILPEVGTYSGKGEALWKSLHVLTGDIIAWIDTDITNIHPRFIYGLLGPLLRNPQLQFVKGYYQRPIKVSGRMQPSGGGRVTELVARPLLNLFYPELSGIIQPLSGEYAGRRSALEAIPFFSGYGVETGMLIDLHEQYGLQAIAQVDLEERVHHNQPLTGLSKMSFAILQVFIARIEQRYGLHLLDKTNRSMKMITYTPEKFGLNINAISDVERPAMNTISTYLEAHGLSK